jgi:putative oxygen-independent coproporphyrinogen III oxidase
MSGLYIHIPFCKKRCFYCGFFSTTYIDLIDKYVDTLCLEMKNRKDYILNTQLNTIYFGGGTPSLLNKKQLIKIFDSINSTFNTENIIETTIECNPDDLNPEYIQMLTALPINRISIGIQTFNNKLLSILGRRHNSYQAIKAVKDCKNYGFSNISIDLMYGLPGQDIITQSEDIKQAIMLDITHISAYHLSYEDNTPLKRMKDNKRILALEEEISVSMFDNVCISFNNAGYNHYEISNFCRDGFESKHNSSYWNNTPYLGIGAGAHSYNCISRQWNPNNIDLYINGTVNGYDVSQKEILSETDKYNENIMLSLRTSKGIDIEHFKRQFGYQATDKLINDSCRFIDSGILIHEKGCIRFKEHSLFISDEIISSLFIG